MSMGRLALARWALLGSVVFHGASAASDTDTDTVTDMDTAGEGEASSEPSDLQTQAVKETAAPSPIPVALTINGGVSLGAYEAGYLYYLTEFFKANPEVFETKVITGASAGTLNAILTLLATVHPESTAVTDSLFFKIWTSEKMNYNNVMDIADVPALQGALSSRRSLSELVEEIHSEWQRGFETDKTLYLGVSTTKLVPREIVLNNGYRLTRQEEKFAFSVTGRGPNLSPHLENFSVLSEELNPPTLNFKDDEANFDIIRDLVFASSAFPLVFLPQRLETRADGSTGTEISSYLDGGVMDNYPLRLAYKISQNVREQEQAVASASTDERAARADREFARCMEAASTRGKGAGARERAESCLRESTPKTEADDLQLVYINPSSTSYTGLSSGRNKEPQPSELYTYILKTLGGFVTAARAKEAYALADENAEVMHNMMVSERSLPLASGHLLNFMGFFDRNFRIYDFYVGMYDGYRFAAADLKASLARDRRYQGNGRSRELFYPDADPVTLKAADRSDSADPYGTWKPFYCIRGMFENNEALQKACASESANGSVPGIDMGNFRKLLQAAFYQLYDHCTEAGRYGFQGKHSSMHCKKAMKGELPPIVAESARETQFVNNNEWRREEEESEFDFVIRLLIESEYYFKELNIDRGDEEDVRVRIRDLLNFYLSSYASSLDKGTVVLKSMGKPLLNLISPPRVIGYVVVGLGAEAAASLVLTKPWMRWNFAFQGKGVTSIGSNTNKYATFGLAVGPEFDLTYRRQSPFLQFRLLFPRIGYQVVFPHMAFTDSECGAAAGADDRRNYCSGFFAQAALAVSFFERIRFQIGAEYLAPGFGALGPDEGSWSWLAEIGWQFLPSSTRIFNR